MAHQRTAPGPADHRILADAAAAKDQLQALVVVQAAQPETDRLWRTVCRWWKEIEVLIVTVAKTAKVEAATPR